MRESGHNPSNSTACVFILTNFSNYNSFLNVPALTSTWPEHCSSTIMQHSCQCWPGWCGLIFYFHLNTYRFVPIFKSWINKSKFKRLSAWFALVTWLLTETGQKYVPMSTWFCNPDPRGMSVFITMVFTRFFYNFTIWSVIGLLFFIFWVPYW